MAKRKEHSIKRVPTLEGGRVALRALRPMDAASIYRYLNDSRVNRWLPRVPKPYRVDDAHAWVRVTRKMAEAGTDFHFGIELRESGEIVGMIGLNGIQTEDRIAEVGYWLGRPYWRQGLMEEALRLIVRFAFGPLRLHRLFGIVVPSNVGSAALLEKVGFQREVVAREKRRTGRGYVDEHVYGLLKEEYKPQGSRRRVKSV